MRFFGFGLTDEEFIKSIRRFNRMRRTFGLVLLFAALLLVVFGGWVMSSLITQGLELSSDFAKVNHPSASQMQAMGDNASFISGLWIGFLCGKASLTGGALLGIGVMMVVFKDRKARMLLSCWDQAHPAPAVPPATL
jgi:hypothetical protein